MKRPKLFPRCKVCGGRDCRRRRSQSSLSLSVVSLGVWLARRLSRFSADVVGRGAFRTTPIGLPRTFGPISDVRSPCRPPWTGCPRPRRCPGRSAASARWVRPWREERARIWTRLRSAEGDSSSEGGRETTPSDHRSTHTLFLSERKM